MFCIPFLFLGPCFFLASSFLKVVSTFAGCQGWSTLLTFGCLKKKKKTFGCLKKSVFFSLLGHSLAQQRILGKPLFTFRTLSFRSVVGEKFAVYLVTDYKLSFPGSSWGLCVGPAYCHFHCILPAKSNHKPSPNSRGGKVISIFWWEELQSHFTEAGGVGMTEWLWPFLHSVHHLCLRLCLAPWAPSFMWRVVPPAAELCCCFSRE